jgi:predicted dinucleotide-binding enzyme
MAEAMRAPERRTRGRLKEADAVLLAVQWSRIDDVLHQAGDLSGKVIVTCLLLMDAGNSLPILRHNRPISAPLVAQVQDVDFSLVWIASGLPTNWELRRRCSALRR